MIKYILFTLTINLLFAMSTNAQHEIEYDSTSASDILVGEVTLDDLTSLSGFEAINEEKTVINNNHIIQTLNEKLAGVKVIAYIGTWCEDSHLYFPTCVQVLRQAGYNIENMTIYALNRDKKSEMAKTEERQIVSVPTIIFLKNDIEIGRFIEYPSVSVLQDIYDILTK